jgi:hypothetical protein
MALIALVVLQEGPAWAVYALVTASAVSSTPFRPAQAALLPSLARTPDELTAANVAASAIASAGAIVGPAVGAAVLAASSVEQLFAFNALTFAWSALVLLGVREPERAGSVRRARNPFGREALAGLGALGGNRDLRFLATLYVAQTLVGGTLGVLAVVTAFDLLDGGDSEVGLLYTAFGIGGLVGGAVALALVGRGRLGEDFGVGLVLFGAPLALVPAFPRLAPVLVLFALVGIGNTLVDVAATTLLQRSVPDDVLARAFGTLQSLLLAALAVGSLLAPLLAETLGEAEALVAVGVVLPVLGLVSLPRLRRVDERGVEPTRELALLRGSPLFAPLPPRTLERLAASLEPLEVPAGTAVVRAGEAGERYYLVAEGTLRVEPVRGEPARLGPGESFGEIALLHDTPRTATVTAEEVVSARLGAGPLLPQAP